MNQQIEREIRRTCWHRLKDSPDLRAVIVPSLNGIWIPVHPKEQGPKIGPGAGGLWSVGAQRKRSSAELQIARLVARLKNDGELDPGCLDWGLLGRPDRLGGLFAAEMEFKRPATRTLLGKAPKGRHSPQQLDHIAKLDRLGIPHATVYSWEECRDTLIGWNLLPPGWDWDQPSTASAKPLPPRTRRDPFDMPLPF